MKLQLIQSIMLLFIFSFVVNSLTAQVVLTEEKWVISTYLVAPSEKSPIFFNDETHQGAAKRIYPYAMNDTYINERVEKAYKALILENEYIKLCVTPEIGGKLYYAIDKTNGYDCRVGNGEPEESC